MGKTYDQLDERLRGWIADQRMFFVATAPSGPGGHVNISPKGHADTFRVWVPESRSWVLSCEFVGETIRPR
jgi:hypothetical protein